MIWKSNYARIERNLWGIETGTGNRNGDAASPFFNPAEPTKRSTDLFLIGIRCDLLPQGLCQAVEDVGPVAPGALAEERMVGYQGLSSRSSSQRQSGTRQRQPHRNIQCPGQVSHCRVHSDHQVQMTQQRRGVREVLEPVGRVEHPQWPPLGQLFAARPFASYQPDSRNAGQGRRQSGARIAGGQVCARSCPARQCQP